MSKTTNLVPFMSNRAAGDPGPAIIYYHDNCPDGVLSGAIAYKALTDLQRKVIIKPITYTSFTHDDAGIQNHADIYFVDFCPKAQELARIVEMGNPSSVTIIDHHKTVIDSQAEYVQLFNSYDPAGVKLELYFALSESGASLTYQYFKTMADVSKFEKLAKSLRRYDLWEHDGDNSDICTAHALGIAEYYRMRKTEGMHGAKGFAPVFEAIAEACMGYDHIHALGVEKVEHVHKLSSELAARAFFQEHTGADDRRMRIAFVESVSGDLVNEVANQVRALHECAFVVMSQTVQKYDGSKFTKLSLRQGNDGTNVDLSKLAAAISPGGGGHHNAAGVSIKPTDWAEICSTVLTGMNKMIKS